jgi:putative SOS response-associated peptidase YedK
MCGRSSLHDAPVGVLAHFSLPPALPGFRGRYNISPSQDQWTIALDDEGVPAAAARRWGLIPNWASDPAIGARMINARSDSLAAKPSWRESLRSRRCIVLADGYYEWAGSGKSKTPWFFHLTGHRAFAMAGLWDRWEKGGTPIETCTIITTDAGARTAAYHHRAPVIFDLEAASEWLAGKTSERRALDMLAPYEESDLECYEVSRYVNKPSNDSAECIRPASVTDGLALFSGTDA